jgi:hypothetical protein
MNTATSTATSLLSTSVRPLTGKMDAGDLAIRSLCRPVFCIEHLIQGWHAIVCAERGEKVDANLSFAVERLTHAKVATVRKGEARKAGVEIESLRQAIRSFGVIA